MVIKVNKKEIIGLKQLRKKKVESEANFVKAII